MPRTRREAALRFADQALNDLHRTKVNLDKLACLYAPVHLDRAEDVRAFITIIDRLCGMLAHYRHEQM